MFFPCSNCCDTTTPCVKCSSTPTIGFRRILIDATVSYTTGAACGGGSVTPLTGSFPTGVLVPHTSGCQYIYTVTISTTNYIIWCYVNDITKNPYKLFVELYATPSGSGSCLATYGTTSGMCTADAFTLSLVTDYGEICGCADSTSKNHINWPATIDATFIT